MPLSLCGRLSRRPCLAGATLEARALRRYTCLMKSLWRISRFMRPYGWYVFFGFWTTVLPVAMELSVPRLLQFMIDEGIRPRALDMILLGAFWMFIAAMIGAASTLGQGWCRAVVSQGVAFDLRHALFRHIQSLSFANLDQMQTGRLMTRVSSDVDVVHMFASAGLALLLRVLLMIVGSIVMLLLTDWQLSLIMFAVAGVSAIFIRYLMLRATSLFTVVQQKLGALNTLVQENLAGIQVVKAFVRGRFEIEQFSASNDDYRERNIEVGVLIAVSMPVLQLLTSVGTVAVLWFGGVSVIGDRLTVGELIAFNNYLMIGMSPLLFLGHLLLMAARAESSAERVLEVLETQPILKVADHAHRAERICGRVVFENVSFHYSRNGQSNGAGGVSGDDVLHGISFVAEPGMQLALLGATGSGKSTLVNLIPRFYDVCGGAVSIDGVNVREWEPAAPAGADRHGAARVDAIQRQRTRQYRIWRAGRDRGRGDQGGAGGAGARLHPGHAAGLRQRGRGRRRQPLRRAETAHRHRARLADSARHSHLRRQHQRGRYGDRVQNSRRAGRAGCPDDHLHHRPAHHQRAGRRSDPGARPRAHRRARHASAAAGKRPHLPRDLRIAAGRSRARQWAGIRQFSHRVHRVQMRAQK